MMTFAAGASAAAGLIRSATRLGCGGPSRIEPSLMEPSLTEPQPHRTEYTTL